MASGLTQDGSLSRSAWARRQRSPGLSAREELGLDPLVTPVSLPDLVARAATSAFADDPYLVEVGGRILSFRDTALEMLCWGQALRDGGVQPGDRVINMQAPTATAVATWLGIAGCRAIEVSVNTALQGPVLSHLIQDADARVAVVEAEFLSRFLDAVLDHATGLRVIVTGGSAGEIERAVSVTGSPVEVVHADRALPPVDLDHLSTFGDPPAEQDAACILYTSGTTGPSKGVVLPWGALWDSAVGSNALRSIDEDRDCYYSPFGMGHVSGKYAVYSMAVSLGIVVLKRVGFKTQDFWRDVREYDCTRTLMMGVMARFLMNQPPHVSDADNPLCDVLMVPLIPDLTEFQQRFGIDRVVTDFSMTELSAPIVSAGSPMKSLKSSGRVRSGQDCRVVDEHDRALGPFEVGELVVRTDDPWRMFLGYWRNHEQTAQQWRNLWFHTGDAFYYDEEGYFFFVDRMKDTIRRRGENVSSMEIESIAMTHPKVQEAAAVALKLADGEEEEVKLHVYAPGGLDLDDLWQYLGDRLAPFMVPRFIEVLDSPLPRTRTEKIRKVDLRERGITAGTVERGRLR